MKKKVGLIIIYNHQFNKNIEILNLIYKERFDCIYHLVPFYQGAIPNVISVYENSYRFQGYIAQACKHLIETDCDSFVFIGDDLLLAPFLNGQNIHAELGLKTNDSFLPVDCFNERDYGWVHSEKALNFFNYAHGSEGFKYLPSVSTAENLIRRHGLNYQPFMNPKSLLHPLPNISNSMPYPLVCGYSDFFIVPSQDLELLAHYCGIFASMNLFVEIALPTALAFSATRLRTKTLNYFSGAIWSVKEIDELLEKHSRNLTSLFRGFPDKKIYLHPIKLSKWNN